jgi:hypothetical protein
MSTHTKNFFPITLQINLWPKTALYPKLSEKLKVKTEKQAEMDVPFEQPFGVTRCLFPES